MISSLVQPGLAISRHGSAKSCHSHILPAMASQVVTARASHSAAVVGNVQPWTSHGQACLSRRTKWKQQWEASQIQPDQAKARQSDLYIASQPAMTSQPMPASHSQPARSSHGQIQTWSANHVQLARSSYMTGQPSPTKSIKVQKYSLV